MNQFLFESGIIYIQNHIVCMDLAKLAIKYQIRPKNGSGSEREIRWQRSNSCPFVYIDLRASNTQKVMNPYFLP